MKRYFSLFTFHSSLLSLLLLAGCTLSMDEDLIDDEVYADDVETKGFDEPYTQKTEYGDITYQYADSTKVLKKAALDYLIQTEDDSVLYFSDNIPAELLIKPGYYVALNCCDQLPFGLCSQVLSLTHTDGVYKMVTTRVIQEKVYEKLEYTIDFDFQSIRDNVELLDSQQCKAHGLNSGDIVLLDRSALGGSSKTRSLTPGTIGPTLVPTYGEGWGATRGKFYDDGDRQGGDNTGETDEDEWTSDEDFDSKQWTEKSYTIFSFSTSSFGGLDGDDKDSKFWKYFNNNPFTELLDKLNDKGISVSLEMDYLVKQKIRQKMVLNSDPQKTVREQWTTDASGVLVDLKCTYSRDAGDKVKNPNDPKCIVASMKSAFDQCRESTKAIMGKDPFSGRAFIVAIPIGTTGIVGFVRIAPHLDFEYGVYGEAQFEIQFTPTTTYAKQEGDDDVTPDDQKEPKKTGKGGFHVRKLAAAGYMQIGGGIELVVGAGAGVGNNIVGLGIGVDVSTHLTVNLGVDTEANYYTDCSVKTDITLQIISRILFGLKSWRIDLLSWPISENKISSWPSCGNKNSAMIEENETSVEMLGKVYHTLQGNLSASFSLEALGLFGIMSAESFKPAMRLYYSQNGETKAVAMELKDKWNGKIERNKTYHFTATVNDMAGYDNLRIYPGYIFNDKFFMFEQSAIYPAVKGEPKITVLDTFLEEKDSTYYDYRFSLIHKFRLDNAQYIKDYWKYGWEVEVSVYLPGDQTAYPSYCDTKDLSQLFDRSGIYLLRIPITVDIERDGEFDFSYKRCPELEAHIRFRYIPDKSRERYNIQNCNTWFTFDYSTPTKKVTDYDNEIYIIM